MGDAYGLFFLRAAFGNDSQITIHFPPSEPDEAPDFLTTWTLTLSFRHVFDSTHQTKDSSTWSLKIKVLVVPELDLLHSERQDFLLKRFGIIGPNLQPNPFPCMRIV